MNKQIEFAKKASEHPIVLSYVHQVCQYIDMLITWCGMSDKLETLMHIEDVHSAGQVQKKDVRAVIQHGNIREQQTCIMNFGNQGCQVIWKLIHAYLVSPQTIPDFINKKELEQRVQRVMTNLGITDRELLKKISLSECKKNASVCIEDKTVECSVVSQSKSGIVTMTRSFQVFEPQFRDVNDAATMFQRAQRILKTITPPLSCREKAFVRQSKKQSAYMEHYMSQPKQPSFPPWITGHMYWTVNDSSFFKRMALKNKHLVVAGPSGNTDLQLDIYALFHNFDVGKAVLGCIAWMGGLDHSLHEIFISALPYGLEYDQHRSKDAATFKLLMKHISRTCRFKPVFETGKVKSDSKLKWDQDKLCDIQDKISHFNKDYDGQNKKCYTHLHSSARYILGRDTLLVKSGWKAQANTCSDIRVMNLPWDDADAKFSKWTPTVNSKLVHCAVRNQEPIMVLISDYDYNLITRNGKASGYEDAIITKTSFTQTNGPAQTAIEMCQILFFWLQNHRVFVESDQPITADDVRYHVCWITKKKKKGMMNITIPFKEAVIQRMTATVPPDYPGYD